MSKKFSLLQYAEQLSCPLDKNGMMNQCAADIYIRVVANKEYGKEAVDKAVEQVYKRMKEEGSDRATTF